MIMTQYTDKVERQRQLQKAEKWGKGVKYIHANNGVIETAFNNGDIKYQKTNPRSKPTWHRERPSNETLIRRFHRALVDMKKEYWK